MLLGALRGRGELRDKKRRFDRSSTRLAVT
jgi:hypothetical protein